jgi:hypothetical protein
MRSRSCPCVGAERTTITSPSVANAPPQLSVTYCAEAGSSSEEALAALQVLAARQ